MKAHTELQPTRQLVYQAMADGRPFTCLLAENMSEAFLVLVRWLDEHPEHHAKRATVISVTSLGESYR